MNAFETITPIMVCDQARCIVINGIMEALTITMGCNRDSDEILWDLNGPRRFAIIFQNIHRKVASPESAMKDIRKGVKDLPALVVDRSR